VCPVLGVHADVCVETFDLDTGEPSYRIQFENMDEVKASSILYQRVALDLNAIRGSSNDLSFHASVVDQE
jgi:hypothetical protein